MVARDCASGKQLIGYVVADAQAGLAEQLRQALHRQLPDYMVPAQLLVLQALPLNPSGKVDRQALPDPDFKGQQYVAPRNTLEQQLAAIWQDVLELETVGVTDNFFELGGDSLRTLKVLSKVRSQAIPGFELKLRDMLAKPTIAQLSGFDAGQEADLDPLLLLNTSVTGAAPLFCLHAGFGTVFDYEPLARQLEGQCSVYGLQCRMLLDRHWEDDSLASMAIDYAQYIRQKQPHGPYRLLGWSLGGTLAVLVASELENRGSAFRCWAWWTASFRHRSRCWKMAIGVKACRRSCAKPWACTPMQRFLQNVCHRPSPTWRHSQACLPVWRRVRKAPPPLVAKNQPGRSRSGCGSRPCPVANRRCRRPTARRCAGGVPIYPTLRCARSKPA
ncbi:hypothetical protein EJJ20_25940 [Pseudomonas poae]|nr:hypothetical protein EJJ20_25940 [Pseudomonas poae]